MAVVLQILPVVDLVAVVVVVAADHATTILKFNTG
jgi:hypothetical protein